MGNQIKDTQDIDYHTKHCCTTLCQERICSIRDVTDFYHIIYLILFSYCLCDAVLC